MSKAGNSLLDRGFPFWLLVWYKNVKVSPAQSAVARLLPLIDFCHGELDNVVDWRLKTFNVLKWLSSYTHSSDILNVDTVV